MAASLPETKAMMRIRMKAQKPNTTSTSPSKCSKPAWRGWRRDKVSNDLAAKVWMSARPKTMALMIWMVVKCVSLWTEEAGWYVANR
ncbi:hypothetical protein D3C72_1382420 [compost metagenome]